eukprot:TRINITY_DN62577_c0_g1_i1.p1 TRINITY_DN62577_c0_g1~~TRINITY_DN62577_c0_g1_i1.p1  ORF type:complete len:196 (+),score=42.13 TRINITY_DN62577_c0_g1_i1:63-650(+)
MTSKRRRGKKPDPALQCCLVASPALCCKGHFPTELHDKMLSFLPPTVSRSLAKRFDKRCAKNFVLVQEHPYHRKGHGKHGAGRRGVLAVAYDESRDREDPICVICGYVEEPPEDSDYDEPPGGYTQICIAEFDAFPFPDLQSLPKTRTMCKAVGPMLKSLDDVYVCNDCHEVIVDHEEVTFQKGDVFKAVSGFTM